jgi:hypothetical protein
VTLTRPGGARSALVFPPATAGRYVVTTAFGGELIAELDKAPGRLLRLALPAGRYLVRKPEGAFVRVGEALVLLGAQASVRDEDMEQVPYAEVARRGAAAPRVWALELGPAAHSATVAGAGFTPGLAVMLQRERGPLVFAAGVEAARTEFAGRALTVKQYELWARGETRLGEPLGWTLPYLGVALSVGVLQQELVRARERQVQLTFGGQGLDSRTGLAVRLELVLGIELPLSARSSLRIAAGAGGVGARGEDGLKLLPSAGVQLAAGMRL